MEFNNGNLAFTRDQYVEAVDNYSKSICQNEGHDDDCYINRAHCFQKLGKYAEALQDIEEALAISPKNSHALYRKGHIAMAALKYDDAIAAFDECEQSNEGCKTKYNCRNLREKCQKNTQSKSSATESTVPAQPEVIPKMPDPNKIKHDWYQTEGFVIVSVLIKNVDPANAVVTIEKRSLDLDVKVEDNHSKFFSLDLAHDINPEGSSYKILSSKVEIKLKKCEAARWSKLEGEGVDTSSSTGKDGKSVSYPTSSRNKVNWDKLEKEVEEEEEKEDPGGDASLQKLFQKIYSQGDEATRKAMNKSFMESGGTCLSTNWKEVGEKPVDIKPPEGLEWKQW